MSTTPTMYQHQVILLYVAFDIEYVELFKLLSSCATMSKTYDVDDLRCRWHRHQWRFREVE